LQIVKISNLAINLLILTKNGNICWKLWVLNVLSNEARVLLLLELNLNQHGTLR